MNDSNWPHAKQQWKSQSTNSEEINDKIDPEWTLKAHLGENPKRGNKQSNDDAKNIAAGHGLFSAWLPIGSKMSEFSNRHYKTSLRPITSRQCPVASNDGSDQQAFDVFTAISKKYVG